MKFCQSATSCSIVCELIMWAFSSLSFPLPLFMDVPPGKISNGIFRYNSQYPFFCICTYGRRQGERKINGQLKYVNWNKWDMFVISCVNPTVLLQWNFLFSRVTSYLSLYWTTQCFTARVETHQPSVQILSFWDCRLAFQTCPGDHVRQLAWHHLRFSRVFICLLPELTTASPSIWLLAIKDLS